MVAETLQQTNRIDARIIAAELLGQGQRSGHSVRYPAVWAGGDNPTRIAVYEHGFYDFREATGGNVVQLVSLILNLSYAEAADWLRARMSSGAVVAAANLPRTPTITPNEPPSADWQQTAAAAAAAAERYLWSGQPDAQRALAYLHQARGLTDDTIRRFHLGYNPAWRRLAVPAGAPLHLAPGIIIPYFDGGALWAVRVRCRVGNLAKALGVAPDRRHDGTELAKYLNLSGSKTNGPIFNGDSLTDSADVLIVEGEFDAMLAQQVLADSARVVTLGSASSRLIRRGRARLQTAGRVYLTLDNDEAGHTAADRLIEALPMPPERLPLPGGKDITEYVVDQGGDLVAWWAQGGRSAASAALMLWQYAPYMICCPEYALIQLHVRQAGLADDFTAAQLAELAGVSKDTAQRWICKAQQWRLVSEGAAELKTIKSEPGSIICKNAARHYHLSPELAEDTLLRQFPDYVQELLAASEPGAVRRDEAIEAGLDETAAGRLALISQAAAQTQAALEINAWVERTAVAKARELLRRAEYDTTSFAPDTLPKSVSELRVQLIEALYATDPTRNWLHSQFMWLVGVKRGSVAALIAKSRLQPASAPTFVDVPLSGRNLRREVRIACIRHSGVPVAWLNAQGEVICPFTAAIPAEAAGVRLNCGKTYSVRESADDQMKEETVPLISAEAKPAPSTDARRQRRMQQHLLSGLRGCLLARGWEYTPGPYGYWTRGEAVQSNTFVGLVTALLLDYEWARAQRSNADELLQLAESLGAEVKELP